MRGDIGKTRLENLCRLAELGKLSRVRLTEMGVNSLGAYSAFVQELRNRTRIR